jgi:hypothetical protein
MGTGRRLRPHLSLLSSFGAWSAGPFHPQFEELFEPFELVVQVRNTDETIPLSYLYRRRCLQGFS